MGSDSLRNAIITRLLTDGLAEEHRGYGHATAEQVADAIFDMPEMEAIKDFISGMANGPSPKMDHGRRQMEVWELPQSVIDWVLTEEARRG